MTKQEHQNFVGIKIKNYSFLKEIGSGSYGKVYDVYDEQKGNNYAAKVVPKNLLKKTPKLMELLKSQIKVLKQCKNQNVVGYIDNFTTDKNIILIMQLCDGGELQQYLTKKKRLTQEQATYFLKQIINGFKGLHEVKAMHRDFKAANVLIHKNICKIADLGFSKQMEIEDMATTVLGTSTYMAPQVLQQKAYGRKADIWSIGVVYYQMLYGQFPYFAFSDKQILKLIQTTRPNYSKVNISNNAKDFIEKCLTANPKERINWSQIYDHPILHQQKMVYSVTSSIRLSKNKQLYEKQEDIEREYIQMIDLSQQYAITAATIDISNKLKQVQMKKKMEDAIVKYEKMYLNYRNKIMFIYKHITPAISILFKKVKANHSIIIFLICKNCCLQIQQFNNYLADQKNFLKINQYWEIFIKSRQYNSIKEVINSDMFLCQLQTNQYKNSMPKVLNQQIKSELEIYKIAHENWRQFYHNQLQKYEFELISGLKQINGQLKVKLIRLILSLMYIREMKDKDELQSFQRKIQNILNYQILEKELYATIQKKIHQISKK